MALGTLSRIAQSWRQWTRGSTAGRIFGAATLIAAITLLVKGLAIMKEFTIAWQLGTGDGIDAFLIAFLIPAFIVNVVANSLNAALMPSYIQVRERQGDAAAARLLGGAGWVSLVLLGGLMLAIAGGAPWYLPVLAPGFGAEKLKLTLHLLWVMVPLIGINGMAVLWGAILNAGEQFGVVAIAPGFTPLVMVGLLLGWPWMQGFALAGGLVVGALLELGLIVGQLRRQGVVIWPRWVGWSPELGQVVGQFFPVMAGACVFASSELIDQSMASRLPAGSVAALGYGNKLVSLPLTLMTTAIGTAVMPYFSRLIGQNQWSELRHLLKKMLPRIFWGALALAVGLAIFSVPIVRLLFEHGAFTARDTALVAQIQAAFALQIPFHLLGITTVRLLSAAKANQVMLYSAVISLAVNVGLNIVLMRWLGVVGIALSTSCVYIVSACFLWWSWRRVSCRLSNQVSECVSYD